MTGTTTPTTDIARRAPGRPAPQAQAALALQPGQTMWDKNQHAALVAMGIPREATSAELGVFLHQCQRTGLDPFSKQIYLIYRKTYENGREINKPTMQVGIDGYRVIRDRIARREGLKVEYEDTVWYDAEGGQHEAWLWDEPPAACRVAISVDGRRFSSVLRFNEYCQRKKDGTLNSMWATKGAHMIEKCCEADVLRRVFPNDLAGIMLDDEMPPDALPAAQPHRVSAETIAARRQTVTATVVTPDTSPAHAATPPAAPAQPPSAQGAGEDPDDGDRGPALISSGQLSQLRRHYERLGYSHGEEDLLSWLSAIGKLAGLESLASMQDLDQEQAALIIGRLKPLKDAQELTDLVQDGVVPGE